PAIVTAVTTPCRPAVTPPWAMPRDSSSTRRSTGRSTSTRRNGTRWKSTRSSGRRRRPEDLGPLRELGVEPGLEDRVRAAHAVHDLLRPIVVLALALQRPARRR